MPGLGPLRRARAGCSQHLDVPVLVDNDVNIMALGERAVAWPGVDHLMFVKVATGIGAGVISGGALQRGAQGIAGDIGHVRVARGAGVPCHCGNMGCLEALASGPAIARALRAQGVPAENGDDVVDLVKRGNIDAIQAVRQAGRDIGEVLTTCVSLVNPSVIAIGGSMARVGEHLIAGVREVVYTRSIPLATEHLAIVQSAAADRTPRCSARACSRSSTRSPPRRSPRSSTPDRARGTKAPLAGAPLHRPRVRRRQRPGDPRSHGSVRRRPARTSPARRAELRRACPWPRPPPRGPSGSRR